MFNAVRLIKSNTLLDKNSYWFDTIHFICTFFFTTKRKFQRKVSTKTNPKLLPVAHAIASEAAKLSVHTFRGKASPPYSWFSASVWGKRVPRGLCEKKPLEFLQKRWMGVVGAKNPQFRPGNFFCGGLVCGNTHWGKMSSSVDLIEKMEPLCKILLGGSSYSSNGHTSRTVYLCNELGKFYSV